MSLKKFIVLSTDGVTIAPNDVTFENFQALGFPVAENANDALDKWMKEHPEMVSCGYDEIWVYELSGMNPATICNIQPEPKEEAEPVDPKVLYLTNILDEIGYSDIEFDYQDGNNEMYFEGYLDAQCEIRVDEYEKTWKIYDRYVTDKHWSYVGEYVKQEKKLLNSDDIYSVDWVVYTDDFVTYEFLTKDNVYVEESEIETAIFRIFYWKKDSKMEILVANSQDYDIHEDVSHLFDLDSIFAACEAAEPDIDDVSKEYEEHYAQRAARGEE
jgi:hypothetical protein